MTLTLPTQKWTRVEIDLKYKIKVVHELVWLILSGGRKDSANVQKVWIKGCKEYPKSSGNVMWSNEGETRREGRGVTSTNPDTLKCTWATLHQWQFTRRDEQTHKASDSDEQGVRETPHWAERKDERGARLSLMKDHVLLRQDYSNDCRFISSSERNAVVSLTHH